MPTGNELKAIISADGTQFNKTLGELTAQLKRFQQGIKDATNLESFARLTRAAQATQARIEQMAVAGANMSSRFKNLSVSTNGATQSMMNMGRIVQDLPFGFLGIANNLNPALESFQRLKAETGSTGKALKAMAGSLMGAGGVGFALSVVSSLLIVFGDRIFGTGKKAKETADKIKELSVSVGDLRANAEAETAGAIVKVLALSNAVLDQTKSYNERNNALRQLQAINKNYFGDQALELTNLAKLKDAVGEYTKAIIAAAVVKGFEDQIGKIAVELSKQEREFNKLGAVVDKFKKKFETPTLEGGLFTGNTGQNAAQDLNLATIALEKQGKVVSNLRGMFFNLSQDIGKAVDETLKFKPLSDTKAIKVDKIKIAPKEVEIVWPRDMKKVELLDFRDFLKEIEVVIPDIAKKLAPIGEAAKKFFANIGDIAAAKKSFEAMKKKVEDISAAISSTLTPAFENMFAAITSGENPLRAFFDSIGKMIQQLIVKLLAAVAVAAILNVIFPVSKGGLGFLGNFTKLLGIGGVANPGNAGGFMSGSNRVNNMNLTGRMQIRGQDLIYVINQTNRSQGRTF